MILNYLIFLFSYFILLYTIDKVSFYNISTISFLILFYFYPLTILLVIISLLVTFYRSYTFKEIIKNKPSLKPTNGDILLFTTNYNIFNKKVHSYANFSKIILWDGTLFSLPKYPITHIGIMLNDKQYIDSFITNNKKYDILTNKKKAGPGLRNINNVRKYWPRKKGDVVVLKTDIHFNIDEQNQIKKEIKGKFYTDYFGCTGLIDYVLKKHNKIKNKSFDLFPSDFMKYGKQFGKLRD